MRKGMLKVALRMLLIQILFQKIHQEPASSIKLIASIAIDFKKRCRHVCYYGRHFTAQLWPSTGHHSSSMKPRPCILHTVHFILFSEQCSHHHLMEFIAIIYFAVRLVLKQCISRKFSINFLFGILN